MSGSLKSKVMEASNANAAVFEEHRTLIFGIAYRMLGSVAEAEDMVQDTYLRWQRQSVEEVKSAKAWLTSVVTRLCIDHLRSARKRREEYVGVWLPEPLVEQTAVNGALADSLSTAFLVLLETLAPAERAVFLLREVFEYDYEDIARMLDKTEANCRQMVRRAKEHVAAGKPRFEASAARNEQIVQEFLHACREGDTSGVLGLLAPDAVMYSDGGGKVVAVREPLVGAEKLARFYIGVTKARKSSNPEVRFAQVNSAPGALIYVDGKLVQTMSFAIVGGRIQAMYVMRNPDKLRHVGVA